MPTSADSQLAVLGGSPHCTCQWPSWPVFDEAEETALLEVLRSGEWWFGEKVRQFERDFASFQGAHHAVSCTNGTSALEVGLRALGVVEGDEVIVPCYSFIATASSVVTVGAIPVFADISPDTLCIDPTDIERKITSRTTAIVPVHVSGLIADMGTITKIADGHNLAILEDSAHAWGSQLDGKGAGTLGRAGTFSFQVTKNITAGEGGILVTNDEDFAELCRSFTNCGRLSGAEWYDHDVLGSNVRMTEFQAALLSAQLSRLEEQVQTRERNAQLLDDVLSEVSELRLLAPPERMTRRSYHMYIFRLLPEFDLPRDRFIEAVNAEGVPVSAGWYRPLYKNAVFQNAHLGPTHGIKAPMANKAVDYRSTNCPVCEQVCSDAVWIPQNVLLASEEDVLSAAHAIRKVVANAASLSGNAS